MTRKLASIQQIIQIDSISGADRVVRAKVLGWNLVVGKDDFKVGDKCVFLEIDSICPATPEFEFMRKYHFRVKTQKLRGIVSQGLAVPLTVLPKKYQKKSVGFDVTKILGVDKYEPYKENPRRVPRPPTSWRDLVNYRWWWKQITWYLNRGHRGLLHFPSVPKTDETRIQAVPEVLTRHKGKLFYVSEKVDGSSITAYYYKGKLTVASRNFSLPRDIKNSQYWVAIDRLFIEEKLKKYGKNVALQGELLGPGIQGNKYNLADYKIYWYNAFDIDKGNYLSYEEFIKVCGDMSIPTVPILNVIELNFDMDSIIKFATAKSIIADIPREGVVFRSVVEQYDPDLGRLSFKVINQEFLIRFDC